MIYETAAEAMKDIVGVLLDRQLPETLNGMYAEGVGQQFIILKPEYALITSSTRTMNYRYMTAEAMWNVADRADVRFLRRYFRGIDNFVADQEIGKRDNATWAYGPMLNNQIRHAIAELRRDPSSRRAIVTTHVFPKEQGTPPCLSAVQWLIRNDELIQITTMRSNDVWLGLPLDLYQFGCFHRMMAAELDIPLGPYIHQPGSLHLYARDVDVAKAFVDSEINAFAAPPFGENAMSAALRDVPGQMVERYGHKMYEDEDPAQPDYEHAPGLKSYLALLMGDYGNMGPEFTALKDMGRTIGF